jgi:hypothetical protein
MGSGLRPWGMGEARCPGTLAAAREFIRLQTIRPTQYWRCFPADLRPVCMRRKRVAESPQKPRPGTVSDPATSVAWCVT